MPKVPSYEEYVSLAEEKGWKIKDPIEKLEDTIRQYPHLFDMLTSNLSFSDSNTNLTQRNQVLDQQLNQMIDYYQQEVDFLIRIIAQASHRRCDLTNAVFLCVEMMNQITYRIMKYRLQTGQEQ